MENLKERMNKMADWNYGGAIDRYPIKAGEVWGNENLLVQVHDLREKSLPDFMETADCVFVDPPWNMGNVNSFITKADRNDYIQSYMDFTESLLMALVKIQPEVLYLEMGKEFLPWWHMELAKRYRRITFYNSTYYHKKDCLCYVIRATNRKPRHDITPKLDGMDEEDIIKWVCENERFNVIADPCMGRGLVGKYALAAGKKAVGTELNPKRLACLLEAVNAEKIS